MEKHEREAYVKVRSTVIQSAITGQIESMETGDKSATDYIAKFKEYLNRCRAIKLESLEQTYLGLGPALGMITAESSSLEASRL